MFDKDDGDDSTDATTSTTAPTATTEGANQQSRPEPVARQSSAGDDSSTNGLCSGADIQKIIGLLLGYGVLGLFLSQPHLAYQYGIEEWMPLVIGAAIVLPLVAFFGGKQLQAALDVVKTLRNSSSSKNRR